VGAVVLGVCSWAEADLGGIATPVAISRGTINPLNMRGFGIEPPCFCGSQVCQYTIGSGCWISDDPQEIWTC
jgi:hypothetical protein